MKDYYSKDEYYDCIAKMHDRMQVWRKANPDITAMVQFIGTDKVIVVAGIYQALMIGVVKTNEHGYNMIKAMCEPEPDEPTIEMVKTAIYLQTKGKQ